VPSTVLDGFVDLVGGRRLKARCYGAGGPTVLLEAGGSSNLDDWPTTFVNLLAAATTTCLYSRAGGAGSTPFAGLLTRAQIVEDAYSLLDSLHRDHGVNGPFVFVGQSFGGSVALAEALEHPETTAGMVILDTNFPSDFIPACIASGHAAADCQATYEDDKEAKSIEKDIIAKVHPLPDIPIAVVSALAQPDCHVEPGVATVTAEIAGTDVTAPDCDALGVVIADKNRTDWGQLGTQVTDTRIDADHDHLVAIASTEIAAIVLRIVTSAR
jgi:pimeloyl-ACP methyl ester carboxylesterase